MTNKNVLNSKFFGKGNGRICFCREPNKDRSLVKADKHTVSEELAKRMEGE
jgi:hypothetical protein